MNNYRRLSLFIVIALIANNISIFAQSASSTQTKKATKTSAQSKQTAQQPPAQNLDKFDMDTAYRIWANWYLAQEQGKQLPAPTVTVTNADEKEIQRLTLIWNQAQQKAALDAPRRREEALCVNMLEAPPPLKINVE